MPWTVRRLASTAVAVAAATSVATCAGVGGGAPPPAAPADAPLAVAARVAGAPSCPVAGTFLQLGCPAWPDTSPVQQPGWDVFAWNSFVAANWPALVPAQHSDQRGFPDLGKSFAAAAPGDLLVWETFKEKREVFLQGSTESPGPWNQEPTYGPVDPPIPTCPGAAERVARLVRPGATGAAPGVERFVGQGTKLFFDSLDETVEVASEAREATAQLCNGIANPQCGTASANDCCLVHGKPVGPRVWKGDPLKAPPQPVLYEVKVNYDYYDYVVANQLYLDPTADAAAAAGNIRLPFRTSAKAAPSVSGAAAAASVDPPQACLPQKSGSTTPHCVTEYAPTFCLDQYGAAQTGSGLTPCRVGSVQIKAAWIPVVDEDVSRYHTAEAAFFRPDAAGDTCMDAATFALVGLHIIQRIHAGAPGSTTSMSGGGTFVYATWEHVDNDQAGFTYANYFQGDGLEPPPRQGFYPQPAHALPVTRKYRILPGTRQVNQAVHKALGCGGGGASVWCNYQLIGTQFQALDVDSLPPLPPTGNPNDPTGIGQPLYLANLVIETNDGLQQFQGLPPFPSVISHFQGTVGNPPNVNAFNRQGKNLASGGKGLNMGGCMGCHGVAQLRGSSFSFVLEDGQAGAGVDTQTSFVVPPLPPP